MPRRITHLSSSTNMSSTGWSTVVYFASTMSTRGFGAKPIVCQTVRLSTSEGAQCDCGKFAVEASALQIKSLNLGEVRQIVASGYKLTHGAPLVTITWA